jgi:hypothetical protein
VDDDEFDSIDLEAWARRVYQDHASDLDDLDGYLVEDRDCPSDQDLEAEIWRGGGGQGAAIGSREDRGG